MHHPYQVARKNDRCGPHLSVPGNCFSVVLHLLRPFRLHITEIKCPFKCNRLTYTNIHALSCCFPFHLLSRNPSPCYHLLTNAQKCSHKHFHCPNYISSVHAAIGLQWWLCNKTEPENVCEKGWWQRNEDDDSEPLIILKQRLGFFLLTGGA